MQFRRVFYEITKVLLSRWPAAVFSESRSTVTSVLANFDDRCHRFHRVHNHIVINNIHVSIIKVMRKVIVQYILF